MFVFLFVYLLCLAGGLSDFVLLGWWLLLVVGLVAFGWFVYFRLA